MVDQAPVIEQSRQLMKQNRAKDAIVELQKALRKEPKCLPIYLELIRIALAQNNHEEARRLFEKATKLDPNDIDLVILEGSWYIQQRKFLEAASVLQWAASQAKNNLAWCNLAHAFRNLGSLDNAEDAIQKSLALNPNYAYAHCEFGMILSALGDDAQAVQEHQRAVTLDPGLRESYEELIRLYTKSEDFKAASRLVEIAQKIFVDKAGFTEQMANLNEAQGDIRKAIAEREELAKVREHFGDHLKLGVYYWQLGDAKKSEQHLKKAMSINAKNWESYFNLAKIQESKGDFGAALGFLLAALKQADPKPAALFNDVGKLLLKQNQFKEAIPYLQQALDVDALAPYPLFNMAIAYHGLLDDGRARIFAQKALESARDEPALVEEITRFLNSLKGVSASIDESGKHFFDLLNHDAALRRAIESVVEQIQKKGPLSLKEMEKLLSTSKTWANLVHELGPDGKATIIEKFQGLNTDANTRYYTLQMIHDIDKNGPFSDEDFRLITSQQLPQRLLRYPKPPKLDNLSFVRPTQRKV